MHATASELRPGRTPVSLTGSRFTTMSNTGLNTVPAPLSPASVPETIIGRDEEIDALVETLAGSTTQHLSVHGPRGSGKTLLARRALEELSADVTTCYVPCTTYDTQYKVLQRVSQVLTGSATPSGYHTTELQRQLEDELADRRLIVVLDEVDFLLENDGNDLLYHLSRMNHSPQVRLVLISPTHPESTDLLEERVRSSLQPWSLTVDRYRAETVDRILATRLQTAGFLEQVERAAVTLIAATTRNVRLGLHWLAEAIETSGDEDTISISEACVRGLESAALQRYREDLLAPFSAHHRLLCEAIGLLTTDDTSPVRTGVVYEQYDALCGAAEVKPVSTRRVGDFLTHLELLGLIAVEYSYGGSEGKTRTIQLKPSHEI